ncbi:hypothetical protein Aph01nite_54870 [Acrocarpospora phusangensis]|uniref:Uncharacterized protein n=1 Tax=Acrocarpospora phusangensis TaxID=1070424 RepID=A0A919QJ69_9ACTN|nr:hypothetical protein Aph01nite_54870 [Acrocarpospora phusangensis]
MEVAALALVDSSGTATAPAVRVSATEATMADILRVVLAREAPSVGGWPDVIIGGPFLSRAGRAT